MVVPAAEGDQVPDNMLSSVATFEKRPTDKKKRPNRDPFFDEIETQ
jgi:hypothetical protein